MLTKVPACLECHSKHTQRDSSYPNLNGMSAQYIEQQLKLFADRSRQGGRAEIMHEIAEDLDDAPRHAISAALVEAMSAEAQE